MARKKPNENEELEQDYEVGQEGFVEIPAELKSSKPKVSDFLQIESPINFDNLTYFDMGVYVYLVNNGLFEIPFEKKNNAMKPRLEESERKLKSLGFIKG